MREILVIQGYYFSLFYFFILLAFTGDTRETSQALANGQVRVLLRVYKTSNSFKLKLKFL